MPGSSVGIVTDYGLEGPRSNPNTSIKVKSIQILKLNEQEVW